MSLFSTFRVYAKTQRHRVQISGINPVMALKVWENRSRNSAHLWLWRRLSADDISAKTDLTLSEVIDGETSYVDAARLLGDGEETSRKIDRLTREDGPVFRRCKL